MAAKRKHSENRQRNEFIGVRLSLGEHAILRAEMARTGKTAASLLRDSFLASVPDNPGPCSPAHTEAVTGRAATGPALRLSLAADLTGSVKSPRPN